MPSGTNIPTGVNDSVERIYQSEYGQGMTTFVVGVVLVVVAYFAKSWLIGVAGVAVAAVGHSRMDRANGVKNTYYQGHPLKL